MPQLPSVLSPVDLPLAELAAARLDGELFCVDSCYSPVDEIEQGWHRVLSLRTAVHERLIAEQLTAAWVWGAIALPPAHHQFCAALGARVSRTPVPWRTVREVIIEPSELTTIAGMQVTIPLRTVVDIVRFAPYFTAREVDAVRSLLDLTGHSTSDVVGALNARRNLPNKRRALSRIHAINVVNRVDTSNGVQNPIEMRGVAHLEYKTA